MDDSAESASFDTRKSKKYLPPPLETTEVSARLGLLMQQPRGKRVSSSHACSGKILGARVIVLILYYRDLSTDFMRQQRTEGSRPYYASSPRKLYASRNFPCEGLFAGDQCEGKGILELCLQRENTWGEGRSVHYVLP